MDKSQFYFSLVTILLVLVVNCSCTERDLSKIPFVDNHEKAQKSHQVSKVVDNDQIGNHILEIFEDSQGNIWFGTAENGAVRFNCGKDAAGIKDNIIDYITEAVGLCGKTVADIAEDEDGILWFGTYSDMCRYMPQTKKNTRENAFILFERMNGVPKLGWGWKNVKTDKNGDLWVNTHHGIFRYENGDFIEFMVPSSDNNKASFCNTPGKVAMYLIDRQGGIWFGTDGDGAYRYDASAEDGNAFTHFTKEDGLSSDNVTGIIEDQNGNIWFSCVESLEDRLGDGGLCRLNMDAEGKVSFSKFPDIKGLFNNNIYTTYEDRHGNIWVGATGVGLYRYSTMSGEEVAENDKFTLFQEPRGINIRPSGYTTGLQSILEDSKGRLWCGFSGGLYRLENHLSDQRDRTSNFVNVRRNGPWN